MDELLAIAQGHSQRRLDAGEVLIADGGPTDALYVLLEGTLRVEKNAMPIATFTDRGTCVGEMALLLGISATADVVAIEPTVVAVVENARALIEHDASLTLALARLLATRLHVMTGYLADIKQQYGDHEGGLGMVDVVLGSLMRSTGTRSRLGSERDPDPEY